MTTLHPMDKWPTELTQGWRAGDSIDVLMHYATGETVHGYRSGWLGWVRYGVDGMTYACDDDPHFPIGWSALETP